MNTDTLKLIEDEYTKVKNPDFKVGDTVEVHTIIRESGKERIQIFKGIVIAIKNSGSRKTFTVRKISYGVGVEKIYPLFSPNISKIKIIKKGKVKKSKLYYIRKRVGRQAMKTAEGVFREGELTETEEVEVEEKQPETEEDKKNEGTNKTKVQKSEKNDNTKKDKAAEVKEDTDTKEKDQSNTKENKSENDKKEKSNKKEDKKK